MGVSPLVRYVTKNSLVREGLIEQFLWGWEIKSRLSEVLDLNIVKHFKLVHFYQNSKQSSD